MSGRAPTGGWSPSEHARTATRAPADGERFTLGSLPPWLRWIVPLVVILLLAGLAFANRPRRVLDDLVLAGTRGPVCEQVLLVVDESGSMRDIAGARDSALRVAVGWLHRNLRSDDQVGIVDFASDAEPRLPVTFVRDLREDGVGPSAPVRQSNTTSVRPALAAATRLSRTACDVDVLLLSDGQFADLPADEAAGRALLRGYGIHDLQLLVPGADRANPPPQWSAGFPDIVATRFDGGDPDATSISIADAVATFTGQSLARGSRVSG